jgi:hypothetical protein
MRIFLCTSKHNYDKVGSIKAKLEEAGHEVTLPNSYEAPMKEEEEEEMRAAGEKMHREWKAVMIREQEKKVAGNDSILVLNFEKQGQPNYIGGATFLEIFKAFELGKKIFLFNPIPEGVLHDELIAMNPMVINGDLTKIN